MAWPPTYPPTTLTGKFAYSIEMLCETMAEQGRRLGVSAALLWLLSVRINTLASRFKALATRDPSASIRAEKPRGEPKPAPISEKRERTPEKTPRTWPFCYFGPPTPMPRGFAALRRIVPHFLIDSYIGQLEHLLTTPEMVELIATTPSVGRILRPLCHLMGVRLPPNLILPKRQRPKRERRNSQRPHSQRPDFQSTSGKPTPPEAGQAKSSRPLTLADFPPLLPAPPLPPQHSAFVPSPHCFDPLPKPKSA
ncbi:MAG: hypothetical protein PHT60_00905 [Acidiphilium sp.]|nr:hypothetical protein [Acidiphilium sp.]MDD4934314.1 hypothetical protein [Acidiphilium sp.]